MAWSNTLIDSFEVGNPGAGHRRLVTITDCVYNGTGYGGGLLTTGATAATGPTRSDLGFTGTTDSSFTVLSITQRVRGTAATASNYSSIPTRGAAYDYTNQALVVGTTGGTDISDVTYRVMAIGYYGP